MPDRSCYLEPLYSPKPYSASDMCPYDTLPCGLSKKQMANCFQSTGERCRMAQWYSRNNMEQVWREWTAGRSDRPPPVGIDGISVEKFEKNLDLYLAEIERLVGQEDRITGSPTRYRFGVLRSILSHRGDKDRAVKIPRMRDQLVLRALLKELQKHLENERIPHTTPCVPACLKNIIRGRQDGFLNVMHADITAFFDCIDHDILLNKLRAFCSDSKCTDLTARLLKTPCRDTFSLDPQDIVPEKGIPQGCSVSGMLGELYLADLDKALTKHDDLIYIRYADDILLMAKDFDTLDAGKQCLQKELEKMKLELNKNKTNDTSFEAGFYFLGFHFTGDKMLRKEKKVERFFLHLKNILKEELGKEADADAFHRAIRRMNREISGSSETHRSYSFMADDVSEYKLLDRKLRTMLHRQYKRFEIDPAGQYRIESALKWAYRYKKDHRAAYKAAQAKFGEV